MVCLHRLPQCKVAACIVLLSLLLAPAGAFSMAGQQHHELKNLTPDKLSRHGPRRPTEHRAPGESPSLEASPFANGTGIAAVDVFRKGEAGYFCIKIPDIVRVPAAATAGALQSRAAAEAVLVAFGEARLGSCSDYAPTHLVSKRSTDNGRSWSAVPAVVHAEGPSVVGNAAPVWLPDARRLLVPFCVNNSRVMVTHSDDEGRTFANPPRDITDQASRPGWAWYGLGPPAGLAVPTVPVAGRQHGTGATRSDWRNQGTGNNNGAASEASSSSYRVLLPGYHSPVHWLDGTFTHPHIVSSEDGGITWSIAFEWTNGTDPWFSNECQLAHIPAAAADVGQHSSHRIRGRAGGQAAGTLVLSARTLALSRAQARSHDGGRTFTNLSLQPGLPQPLDGVEGSILWDAPREQLLLSSLSDDSLLGLRRNLSLSRSRDGGDTWEPLRVLDPGASAYSALVGMPGGAVGVIFERAKEVRPIFVPDSIAFGVVELG